MNGTEWLEQVFERGLHVDGPAVYPELRGALHALSACGVLTHEAARTAEERLDKSVWAAPAPAGPVLFDVRAPATTAGPTRDVLEAVLAPARELADVDGITVMLVSVELWRKGVFLRFAGLPTRLTDELEADFQDKLQEWAVRAQEARKAGAPLPDWTGEPAGRLLGLPLSVSDDMGTQYQACGRSAGGVDMAWRSEWRFEPGVPREATRLTVAIESSDGQRHVQELALSDAR